MDHKDGIVVVDTPPGDERIVRAAIERADAIVIPTRAGGVEPTRVASTLEMIPSGTPAGVAVCAARLGTFDLAETIRIWRAEKIPVWVAPERVAIAIGPEGRLSREGINAYGEIFRWARRRSGL
jgi:chromosome partitioning protein